MNFIALCILALTAVCAAQDWCPAKCPGAADRSECSCCPEPCCCRCTEKDGTIEMCTSKLDVILIIDSSGSIRESGWELVRNFLDSLVGKLDNIGTDIKVALVRYSDNATLDWNLASDKTSSKSKLRAAINKLDLIGGVTNTVEGLELALSDVLGGPGDSPDRNNVVFFFSDGRTTYGTKRVPGLALQIQQQARVVSVGVTNMINSTELNIIASGDDGSNFFEVSAFEELANILEVVATRVCTGGSAGDKECFCCCPPPWELRPKTWYYGY